MDRTASVDLLEWQRRYGRDLEVRAVTDAWPVLVVEVMSQQTQITRVGPKHRAFMERWPTPRLLADASTRDLLEAWAGLGYNRRALNLRETARAIVRDHGGVLPDTLEGLTALPGVGPYTARAVLAIAFGQPWAPLDVNVRRVVRRFLGGVTDEASFQRAADALVPPEDPRHWVWAVMDLAATICTPRAPRCDTCPLALGCRSAGSSGDPAERGNGVPFPATNRWLRGALLRAVRAAPAGAWTEFREVGLHDRAAVLAALRDLEAEGFLERRGRRARLAE